MKVMLKGMGNQASSIPQQVMAPVVQNPPANIQASQVGSLAPSNSQIGGNQQVLLVDAYIKPGRTVNPFEIAPCD